MTLKELQQYARNGERFIVFTAKGRPHQSQWLDVRRGLFLLGARRIECDVKGAPDARVIVAADQLDDGELNQFVFIKCPDLS